MLESPDEVIVPYDEDGETQFIRFIGRAAKRLRFLRWLQERGRLSEEVSRGDADHEGVY